MRKGCLLVCCAVLLLIGGVIVYSLQYPDLNIHVSKLYEESERVVCLDGKYYYTVGGKITDAESGKIIYDSNAESLIVNVYDDHIWTAEKSEDSTKVSAVDGAGKVINSYSLPVPVAVNDFMIEDNIIFCVINNSDPEDINPEKFLKVYELSDDNIVKPMDIAFPDDEVRSFETRRYAVDLSHYFYNDIRCVKITAPYYVGGIAMSYNNGEKIIPGYSFQIFAFNENEMIFSDSNTPIFLYKYDFDNGSATVKEPVIGKDITGSGYISGYFDRSLFNDSNNVMLVAQDTAMRSIGREAPIGISDEMKRHMNDYLLIFDTDTLELKSGRKTKTFERIIYADAEKAITYYKGNYITYSISDWKRIGKTAADEIMEGGSYTFELCGEYVFVFDDNSGECINRIAI